MNQVLRSWQDLIRTHQNNRILRLSFPHNDAPACDLLVNKLEGYESISRGFEFTIELLSDNPCLALKDVLGKLLCVELVRKDGTLRYFTGCCFTFSLKKIENIAFYEAKLVPWFNYLDLRKDNYLFHNATLAQQTASIFSDYATHAVWDHRLRGADEAMTDACQFDESDANYLQRRWEAAGWHYFHEHGSEGHKLVLSDNTTYAEPIEGDPQIRLLRHGGAQEEDAISEWSAIRQIIPSTMSLSAFDFKSPTPRSASAPTIARQGGVLAVESYEYAGAHGFKNRKHADQLADLRMEELEGGAKHFAVVSNNFRILPGRYFKLADARGNNPFGGDENAEKNAFLVLEAHHVATNNYLQSEQKPEYSNRFTCTRKTVSWRPGRSFNSVDTKILAPQTVTVVGPEGQGSIHVDQYGRIRVQFHWDREGKNNDASSAWVRMATPWAGNQSGMIPIHRVGSEAVLVFLDGNPDRPLVMAGVHNAHYTPPWSLPTQQALTGLRSRE